MFVQEAWAALGWIVSKIFTMSSAKLGWRARQGRAGSSGGTVEGAREAPAAQAAAAAAPVAAAHVVAWTPLPMSWQQHTQQETLRQQKSLERAVET